MAPIVLDKTPPLTAALRYRSRVSSDPNRRRSATALVLAALPLVVTWPIAAVMAVRVLLTPGQPEGRRRAAVALTLCAAWVTAAACVVADRLSADPLRPDGPVATRTTLPPALLRVGDCVSSVGQRPDVDSVTVLPCESAHSREVFAVIELRDRSYPGNERVASESRRGCTREFGGFIGRSFRESELALYYLYPREAHWADDRTTICLVESGEYNRGTLEGADK